MNETKNKLNDSKITDRKDKKDKSDRESKGPKKSEKKVEKKPTKEELLKQVLELEEKYNKEKNITKQIETDLKQEIDKKDKVEKNMIETNKKLAKEVDLIKKLIKKREQQEMENEKLKSLENKENPTNIVIKVKEAEIASAIQLVEQLKKKNHELKKALSETSDYNKVLLLQNKIVFEENRSEILNKELKLIDKVVEERKKELTEAKKLEENESKKFDEELKVLKSNLKKEVKNKIIEEKALQNKKLEMCNLKRQILTYEDKHGTRSLELKLLNDKKLSSLSISKYHMKEEIRKNKVKEIEEKVKDKEAENEYNLRKSMSKKMSSTNFNVNSDKNKGDTIQNLNKSLSKEKNNIKLNTNDNNMYNDDIPEINNKFDNNIENSHRNSTILLRNQNQIKEFKDRIKLFNKDDRVEFEKVLEKKTLDLYENRYSTMCYSKLSDENKNEYKLKILNSKLSDIKKKIDLNQQLIQQSETKGPILLADINEINSKNLKTTEQINIEMEKINENKRFISDKENENKKLIQNMKDLKIQFERDFELIINPPKIPSEKDDDENEENEDEENEEDDDDN